MGIRLARALLLGLVSSVAAKGRRSGTGKHGRRYLGDCSALKGIELRRCLAANGEVELVTDIPEECAGSKDLDDCLEEYGLKQTILAQHNLDSVPKDCEGENSNSLEACLTGWEMTQIFLGLSDIKIPPECEGLEKENKLKKCLEEHTLSPTSYPTPLPTTKPPTLHPIQWSALAFTTSSLGVEEVVLDIGIFVMRLTTYSQTSREVGILTREHELAAARQHLRETYEDAFHIAVITVDLEFVDGGLTTLSESDSMIRHSTFFGNATFAEEDPTHSLPTSAQLESATLQAFSGASKEEFIKKYHFLATGDPSYFGLTNRYDVSVRKLINNEVGNIPAATQAIQGIQGEDEAPKVASAAGFSRMFTTVMTVFGFVLLGTLIGLAVLVRKRKLDRVPSAQDVYNDFMGEEIDVIGSRVGSDVSQSPQQLLEEDGSHSYIENISPLGIDLSPSSDVEDENREDASCSTWSDDQDSRNVVPYIDLELEIGSQCKELRSVLKRRDTT